MNKENVELMIYELMDKKYLPDKYYKALVYFVDLYKAEKEKNNGAYHTGFIDGTICKKYEFQDKIKAKIEEYNEMIKATYREPTYNGYIRSDNCLEIISVLQELLKED